MSTDRPTVSFFLADALHRLRRPIVPTLVAALILFAGTVSIFATTGLALAGQQATIDRINSPEGRLITVVDPQGEAALSPESVALVASLTGVEWVIGVGPANDAVNAAIPAGAAAPARALFGSLPPPLSVTPDRVLRPGDALVEAGLARVLGLGNGVGAITSRTSEAVVIGSFTARAPLERLNDTVLIVADPRADARMLTMWVSVHDVSLLPEVERAVRDTIVAASPGALRVETSSELTRLSADVARELGRSAQITVSSLLLAVSVLIAAVQFGRVSSIARDIGRARALGATRSTIVMQILINAALCAIAGIVAGVGTGLVITLLVTGAPPGVGFTTGVGILMLLAALVGSLPPAIRAARLDPVRILRVP